MASLVLTRYAQPSHTEQAVSCVGHGRAGRAAIACLYPRRVHAGRRRAVSAGTLSGVRRARACASLAPARFAASCGSPELSLRQRTRSRTGIRPLGLRSSRTNTLPRGFLRRTPAVGDCNVMVSPASRTPLSRLVSYRPAKRAWKRCIPRRARRSVWILWGACHVNCLHGPSRGPNALAGVMPCGERNARPYNSRHADGASCRRCR